MIRLLVLLSLAACATSPNGTQALLRDPAAQIASQSDVTLARLSGEWRVVQGAGIAPGSVVAATQHGLRIGPALYVQGSAGRFKNGADALWVHWLDGANRTAALGDPKGTQVWIMDRTATSSPDRLRAAREILAWYGYDLRRLEGA